jgi:hypothetical protein
LIDTVEGCTRTRKVSGDAEFVGELPPDPWVMSATTVTTYECSAPPDGSPLIHVTYSTPDGTVPELEVAGFVERRGDGVTYRGMLTRDNDGLSGAVYDWPDASLDISLSMPYLIEGPDEDGCISSIATSGTTTVPLVEALAGPIHVTLDQEVEGWVCGGETSNPNAPAITLPPTDSLSGAGPSADRPSPAWLLLVFAGAGIVIGCRRFGHRVRGAAH